MIHRKKDRHFLSHTIEHLFGTFFILAVAVTLGYVNKSFNVTGESMLAQTTASFSTTTTTVTTAQVAFSVTRIEATCTPENITKAKYGFTVSPFEGGQILLTHPSANVESVFGGSTRFLGAGNYSWKGQLNAGYQGANSGTFTVEELCPNLTTATPSPAGGTVSPAGTAIPTATKIIDTGLNTWTVVEGVIKRNGVNAGFSANVTTLYFNGTTIFQQNAVGGWWFWDGAGWVATTTPLTIPTSPAGTTIPETTKIVDTLKNTWTVVGGVVKRNGVMAGQSANVTTLYFNGSTIFQQNADGGWWSWNGSGWTIASNPIPVTTTATTPPPTEVFFSVQPAPKVLCDTGKPLTPVFLAVTKPLGGEFLITSDTGMSNAPLSWGEYPLPNGNYRWRAYVHSGYVGIGELFGSFMLQNTCPTIDAISSSVTTSTTETTSTPSITTTITNVTSPTVAPLVKPDTQVLPRAQVSLFLDNKPITASLLFDQQIIEVRIATAISSSVELKTIDALGGTRALGNAVIDDLLSRPGVDIWTYDWNLGEFPTGVVQLFAHVTHDDGRVSQSERMSITVKHPHLGTRATAQAPTVHTSVRVSQAERESILARVDDPASCANNEECRIYCRSNRVGTEKCLAFAQEALPQSLIKGGSLADGISDEALSALLDAGENRPNDIPDIIMEPNELRQYCADAMRAEVCITLLLEADLATKEDLLQKKEDMSIARTEERKLFSERVGARVFLDTDDDGVTDYDEVNIYKTNPANSDSDADGFQDGAEILARTNPRGGELTTAMSSTGETGSPTESDESMEFENPIFAGTTESAILIVQNVEVAEVGMGETGTATAKKLKLAGRAVPNSFVTLYIFSDPIVVTVKADAAGSWTYTLDKELPDGTHQVYSAITDGGGRILAKSQPLPFVKVAAAVSVGSPDLMPQTGELGFFSGASLYAMIAIMLALLGVALSIIGFIVRQKNDTDGLPGA